MSRAMLAMEASVSGPRLVIKSCRVFCYFFPQISTFSISFAFHIRVWWSTGRLRGICPKCATKQPAKAAPMAAAGKREAQDAGHTQKLGQANRKIEVRLARG